MLGACLDSRPCATSPASINTPRWKDSAATQRYAVIPHSISNILSFIRSGEIAIPEIQRPFVWDSTKVRNLLDSLYRGYPVGYLIAWRNPTVRLKDGSRAAGKKILIDGQQRVTALMAAILGHEVLTKDYDRIRIQIAFHPLEERFEVVNAAIAKDPAWISDVATLFGEHVSQFDLLNDYLRRNPGVDRRAVERSIGELLKIPYNHVGMIELAEDLDIETVTEIFIRVNSAGVTLNQADFAMSKLAADQRYGGPLLRRAIDYFCHAAAEPEFLKKVRKLDPEFVSSEYHACVAWLADAKDDLYEPSYTDLLRVAFTAEFARGRLADLVALLSGRNFETREYEDAIAADTFERLRGGVREFIRQSSFENFVMIVRSAGFVTADLLTSNNALNFAYVVYLRGRRAGLPVPVVERAVRRWLVMSLLRGRYTGVVDTTFDRDIRAIESRGLLEYVEAVCAAELSDGFWTALLPQALQTSSARSPYFQVFKAAQAKAKDTAFLSRDITVYDVLLNHGDVHHVYPKNHLRRAGLKPADWNQVANLVVAQTEVNIAISDRNPELYFRELAEQCRGGPRRFGGIDDRAALLDNLRAHALPECLADGEVPPYPEFLAQRRLLIADRLRRYFDSL